MDPLTRLLPGERRERAAADRFAALLERQDVLGEPTADDERAVRITELLAVQAPEPAVAPADFRDGLRTRLMAVAAVHGVGEPATTPTSSVAARSRRVPRALTVAVGAMASVVAVGGVAAAGSQSLPGDPFYGVKRTVEAVQLATTDSRVDRGERHLALAEERLGEVRGLMLGRDSRTGTAGGRFQQVPADAERDERVVETLVAMDDEVRRGDALLTGAYRSSQQGAPLRTLSAFSDEQVAELERLLPALPAASRARAGSSLALLSAVGVEARALLALAGCSSSCVPTSGPAGGPVAECDCPRPTGTPGGPQGPVAPSAPGSEPVPPTAPVPGEQPGPGQPAPSPAPGPGAPAPGQPGQPGPGQPAPTVPGLPVPPPGLPTAPPLPLPLPQPSSLPSLPLPLPSTVPLPGNPLPETPVPQLPLPDVPLPLTVPLLPG